MPVLTSAPAATVVPSISVEISSFEAAESDGTAEALFSGIAHDWKFLNVLRLHSFYVHICFTPDCIELPAEFSRHENYRPPEPACPCRPAYPVEIHQRILRNVKINNLLDCWYVYASRNNIRGDKYVYSLHFKISNHPRPA